MPSILTNNPVLLVAAYIVAINVTGFIAFAWDKHCSQNGMWRTKESTLLMLAVLGGTIGTIFGQRLLRHKTRKQPFKSYLLSIAALQVVLIAFVIFLPVSTIQRSVSSVTIFTPDGYSTQ